MEPSQQKQNEESLPQTKVAKQESQRSKKKIVIRGGGQKQEIQTENVQKVEHEVTEEDRKFIYLSLKNSVVFYGLDDEALENIVSKMQYYSVNENENVFKQGDHANCYFIIEKGSFDVLINDKVVRKLNKGEGFGELALLYNAPRSATIESKEKSFLWGIDRATFRKEIEEFSAKQFEENRKFMEKFSFFQHLTENQKDGISMSFISLRFSADQVVCNQGDQADSLYLIKEGKVNVIKDGKEIRVLNEGEYFGEQALHSHSTRQATIKAIDEVKILSLSRDNTEMALGDKIHVITFKNLQKWAFEEDPMFSKLTKLQIQKLVDANKNYEKFQDGHVLASKGSKCGKQFWIVLEGSIYQNGNELAKKNQIYGSEHMLQSSQDKTYQDGIVTKGDCVISTYDYETLTKALGGSLENAQSVATNSHESKMNNTVSEMKDIGKKIELKDLIFYKDIGYGQFGHVYLVKHPDHKYFFALKCISKQQVIEQGLEVHVQQEKSVMELCNYPFIMDFVKSYQDENYIYFLLEFIKGMELFDVIRELGIAKSDDVKFYVGSMFLTMEHLHNQNIIYRDLKPENVIVDEQGYLKLIDMGTAKVLTNEATAGKRTYTIIGTPHYMAPEVMAGKGYTFSADLWSIGVCGYELLAGCVPYGDELDDPYEIYEEILTKPVRFPGFVKDQEGRQVLSQLLNKVSEQRSGGSFAALKAHKWFDGFDWDKLYAKQLSAPFIPPQESLIGSDQISAAEKAAKHVTAVLQEEHKNNPFKYNKNQAANPNWDKDF